MRDGLSWTVDIASRESGTPRQFTYRVRAKGDNALVECLAPPKNKGDLILFNDRTLWYYRPGLRRPVSLSPRQRLTGQAANGDISSTHYARDYDVTSVTSVQQGDKTLYRLELKAKAKNVTYDRIRYWISAADRLGVKAEFLTLQGELFKVATFAYAQSVTVEGKQIPFVSEMTITHAQFTEEVTTIRYGTPTFQVLADSLFNVNNLSR
jgi:outer membrane lipoprotein-sorting protein